MRFSQENNMSARDANFAVWLWVIAVAVASLIFTGCALLDIGDTDGSADPRKSANAIELPDPTSFNRSDYPDDQISMTSAIVRNDSLVIDVTYSGGCADHVVRLIASNYWLESLPVQLYAVLAHDDGDDPCDAIVSSTVAFDLEPLRDSYHDSYGPPGDVIIRVFADSTQSQSVRYQF